MYRRFYFQVVARVVLLLTTIILLAVIFGDQRLFFNQIILATIIVVQVAELIHYVNRTNRELAKLFNSVRHSDFSASFEDGKRGRSFRALQESLGTIIKAYKEVKIEREAQLHFLQMLVNQLHIGIISLNSDSDVVLINPTAEEILGAHGIRSWRLLRQRNSAFAAQVELLDHNGRKLIELKTNGDSHILSLDVRTLLILDKPQKLITFQNINSEVEQKEIEAWQKLIRILTHEIMNSVTPISSLTETLQGMLEDREGIQVHPAALSVETVTDIRFSLRTIQKRSDGLLTFLNTYRKFTRITKPVLDRVEVRELFEATRNLMIKRLDESGIRLRIAISSGAESAFIDRNLFEQVLINMVNNSMYALRGRVDPEIELLSYIQNEKQVFEIKDNGSGIPEKELKEIFIPFFTTKKDGSGIGLSLSKQIVSLHGGTIQVKSMEDVGTSFLLSFRRPGAKSL